MSTHTIDEQFEQASLDPDVWFPYYLPHWSSREAAAATYRVENGELCLSIPEDQPLWCPDLHAEPLRVSCVQTGSLSGPVGSALGQQPFQDGLVVREEQPTFWGYTPRYGQVEVTMRGSVSARSMFAFWLSGIEDRPERSGEICVAEIFGENIEDDGAHVGIGIHAFRDPSLTEEFSTVPLDLDVSTDHTYGIQWLPDSVTFTVDGETVRTSTQSPDYPMQLMIGVFDFPTRAGEDDPSHVPELWVSHVFGQSLDGQS
ncbi:MAG: glycoside hydrolase family 16 protein [Acidimicrobiia bacterium]|jgi:hypothetical protein